MTTHPPVTSHIDIQHASSTPTPISDELLIHWATLAILRAKPSKTIAEMTLRLVDKTEITHLNYHYRMQNKATNVLAFPAELPNHVTLECPLLGDVVICTDVLHEESLMLDKSLTSHWALMVIHGTLHLLGYDHIHEDDAARMQSLEIQLLAELGFDNPYLEDDGIE